MLVVLKCSHTDLQSLQAPCLIFYLIVIQAFCFFSIFSIWFCFLFFFIIYLLIRCRFLWCPAVWSGTAGYSAWCKQDGGSPCRASVSCVTPCQAISWVAAALAHREACSIHLPPLEGRYQPGGNGGSGAFAIPAPRFASMGARMFLAQHRIGALELPPVDNRLSLHGFKTWLL